MIVSSLVLAQSTEFVAPSYFNVVLLGLLALGAIGWLVAAVLGFARARAFGPATRWFAFSAVALLIYHLQFVLMVLAANSDPSLLLKFGAFFDLFVVVGAVCAIIGFARMTGPR
ncbi:MAG: hypothetical protein QOJ64_3377 [Acidobacteriota bacterium]|jgi:hypothetical protein|nr:hypothetical protein [Acidobacteriota bacterium]